MFTKRQYTEIEKRQDKIGYLLSEKAKMNLTGIDYDKKQLYIGESYKSNTYVYAYFTDYKSVKAAQDYMILLLSVIDEVITEGFNDMLCYKFNNKGL